MRIATGGFSHETNGFGSILVTSEVLRVTPQHYGSSFCVRVAEAEITGS